MQKVCAWCGKVIREAPGESGVSHGICAECLETFEREMRDAYPGLDAGGPGDRPHSHNALENLAAILGGFSDFALVAGIFLFAILLACSALHFLTGGWFPDLIQWMVERPLAPLK